ncbi:ABC transporter permease [Geosporobacter ferrireducens]|uniref:ABC transporter n=1 Tax=Geosporobacter ferrireducens TaxID=1424294 RepID=A0A1D8GFF5_9FIRM|nr:ABC transporter permease [Geosporobacter ferrireducens]AOT69637.1 ABC transporter [Geosporobacter ferrireducens]MTI54660.1 ABC transporter permease [Geosporobacter ferrireducens]
MKRILSIFKRDLKSGTREFLLLYIILAPILISIGLRFFIPSVDAISFQFALDETLNPEVIETFNKYGKVEILEGRTAIEDRVSKVDDIIGITQNEEGKYIVILEGNEKESSKYIAQQILNRLQGKTTEISASFSDIGTRMSSIAIYGTSSAIILAIVLSGMVIGLNIVEEKEAQTISALRVSPMGRMEFILGKSLIGVILPIVETIIVLWILGISDINFAMIFVMTIVSSLVAIIMGFLMGVLSSNQITAIANMKFLLIIVSASFIGAVVLPENLQVFLYWSPMYWSAIGLIKIVLNSAGWGQVVQYTLWILALTVFVFLIFRRKIEKRLS